MSRFPEIALAALFCFGAGPALADRFPGIGRTATPAEVAAWDIDVRPDFQGLPRGSGSVAKGQEVWEAKCASCHGVFGESNQVFFSLIGGTGPGDVAPGRVRTLAEPGYPGRTTLMKLPTLSTLWDYINRAMPWNEPKSLTVEEVYAATAYMLHLGGLVDEKFVLSDSNIRDVQQRLPNRNGMTTAHALWPGKEFGRIPPPDVRAPRCMTNCQVDAKVASLLPEHARDAHGNLAEQNRLVGGQRGVDTSRRRESLVAAPASPPAASTLLAKNSCVACHAADRKLVGPSWREIARRHEGKVDYLAAKIRGGGAGVWGAIPMPPQQIAEAEARSIADWLASGARDRP